MTEDFKDTVLPETLIEELAKEIEEDTTWNYHSESKGFKIWTKPTKYDNDLLAFRFVGFLKGTSMEKAIDLLHTNMVERHKEWNETYVGGKYLKKFTERHNIQYWEYTVPWPFVNRDFLVERKMVDHKNGVLLIDKTVSSNQVPETDLKVRCKLHFNVRYLVPKDDGIQFYYSNLTDIGGHIPKWLTNHMNSSVVLGEILHIASLIKKIV